MVTFAMKSVNKPEPLVGKTASTRILENGRVFHLWVIGITPLMHGVSTAN